MNDNHTTRQTVLSVTELKKHFPLQGGFFQRVTGWVKAVDGVNFAIEKGKTLGLVGESGNGLPAPRFSYYTDCFTRFYGIADAIEYAGDLFHTIKVELQIFN